MLRCVLAFCVFVPLLGHADPRALLQLVDYVGVDYPEAVADGEVINALEYTEMQDFGQRIRQQIDSLDSSPVTAQLRALASTLISQIEQRAAPADITATTRSLRELVMGRFDLDLVPRQVPDLQRGASLYAENCAMCHGVNGRGDGPAGLGLEPTPTGFHDPARARERSVYGLYNTITLGVEGTAMAGFAQLSDADRWALAFYVSGLYAVGQPPLTVAPVLSLNDAVTKTPAELAREFREGEGLAIQARLNPAALFSRQGAPLDVARVSLMASLAAFKSGHLRDAHEQAVRAYLEGFELTEAALGNVAPDLMRSIENKMIRYRSLLDSASSVDTVQAATDELQGLLDQAEAAMADEQLSAGMAFASSLIILLREGLEAILVIAAMAAFLIKTDNRAGLRWLHTGWILALAAGAGTWFVATYLIDISGALRELTEGFTALFAAVILFYVGFWMHARAKAKKWNDYINKKMGAVLSRQTLWAIAVVSFIAAYREIFETVLFFQALWVQVGKEGYSAVGGGAMVAIAILALLTFAINYFGLRLPLGRFFSLTSYLMIGLAIIFAGKGVAALQEAGKLPFDAVNFPRIELLGIYPNAQGLMVQALVMALAIALLVWQRRRI